MSFFDGLSSGRDRRKELFGKWPKDVNGDFVAPKYLKHCTSTDLEDEMLVSMLEAYGIPAVMRYPNDGEFGRVILGISGNGTDIFVPETSYNDALALLEQENGED